MHHFAYRDGVLHAEAVNLDALAQARRHAVLLLFDRDAGAALPRVRRRLRRRRRARLLRHEGQFQSGGDRDAGAGSAPAPTWSRAASSSARARPAFRRTRSCSPASARPRDELGARGRRRHSLRQCRIGAGARAAVGDRGSEGPHRAASRCASIPTSMPRPTPRSRPARPRTSSAFRSAARARSMRTPPSCPGVKVAGVDMHIGSQITELDAVRRCLRAACRISCATLRADGHTISHVDLGGGLGIPYREDNEPPPDPAAYAAVVKRATRGLDCTADLRAGPPDRRQCRHPGDARALS